MWPPVLLHHTLKRIDLVEMIGAKPLHIRYSLLCIPILRQLALAASSLVGNTMFRNLRHSTAVETVTSDGGARAGGVVPEMDFERGVCECSKDRYIVVT